jgi:hypothetical protein
MRSSFALAIPLLMYISHYPGRRSIAQVQEFSTFPGMGNNKLHQASVDF